MDKTFWRRFSQKILIGLPDKKLMPLLLKHKLSNFTTLLSDAQYEELAEKMDGYTPGDINNLINYIIAEKTDEKYNKGFYKKSQFNPRNIIPCEPHTLGSLQLSIDELDNYLNLDISPITLNNISKAIRFIPKSVSKKDVEEHKSYSQNVEFVPMKPQQTIKLVSEPSKGGNSGSN